MAFNYIPVYVYCGTYFFYHEQTVRLLLITFVSGVISCIFYFASLPFLGVNGAIIGFYIGCLYQGYSGYFFSFYKENTIYRLRWELLLVLQLSLTLISYLCVDFVIPVKILITVVFMAMVGSFFFNKILGRDRAFLSRIVFQK